MTRIDQYIARYREARRNRFLAKQKAYATETCYEKHIRIQHEKDRVEIARRLREINLKVLYKARVDNQILTKQIEALNVRIDFFRETSLVPPPRLMIELKELLAKKDQLPC